MAVIGNKDNYLIERFNEEYVKALKWYKTHPKEAGILAHKYIKMLLPKAVEDSLKYVQLNSVNAKDAKKDLEFFYEILKNNNPKTIGGKLPDDGFYR